MTTLLLTLLAASALAAPTASPHSPQAGVGVQFPERVVRVASQGTADLDLAFDEFFDGAFTLSAWFQPEFVRAFHAPIFGENGSGRFFVGQTKQGPGDVPRLRLTVGNETVYYTVPDLERRTWHHLAVSRSAFVTPNASSTFSLWLDGRRLTPESGSEIAFSSRNIPNAPSGNLRIGRVTPDTDMSRFWQFHGLVDEVAVYRAGATALSIGPLANGRKVVVNSSLIKGFTFDAIVESSPKLRHSTTFNDRARRIEVPAAAVGSVFDLPEYASPTYGRYTLPFARSQAWRVTQEFDDTRSHAGEDAFCWDFVRVGGASQGSEIFAAAPGNIIMVDDSTDDRGTSEETDNNQPWKVWTHVEGNEMTSHKHLAEGSVEDALCNGECKALPNENRVVIPVTRGQRIGKVGTSIDASNSHLHFCMMTVPGGTPYESVTLPLAFSDYQLCVLDAGESVSTVGDLSQCTWRAVERGMPRQGQIIRRR